MAGRVVIAPNATLDHTNPQLLADLQRVADILGVTLTVVSGYRTPAHSVAVGGFANDPHTRGIAADVYVGKIPLGLYPGGVAATRAAGLVSGATPGFYNGQPDNEHVQLPSGAAVTTTSSTKGDGSTSAGAGTTQQDFFTAVLKRMGAPATQANLSFLYGWAHAEGTAAAYNPLATTQREQGSTGLSGNSAGVQNYTDAASGEAATAATLSGGHYPNIAALLRSGKGLAGVTPAIYPDLNLWQSGKPGNTSLTGYIRNVLLSGQTAASQTNKTGLQTVTGDVTGAVGAVESVGSFLGDLTNPSYILRGLQVVGGGVLVFTGAVLLAKQVGLAPDLPTPLRPITQSGSEVG